MTYEDRQLLLKDLCARLPFGIRCSFGVDDAIYEVCGVNPTCCGASEIQATHIKSGINGDFTLNSYKPYLFPLSSMTGEQRKELQELYFDYIAEEIFNDTEFVYHYDCINLIDWLNKNHFDYRDLIPMGLANDATNLNIY